MKEDRVVWKWGGLFRLIEEFKADGSQYVLQFRNRFDQQWIRSKFTDQELCRQLDCLAEQVKEKDERIERLEDVVTPAKGLYEHLKDTDVEIPAMAALHFVGLREALKELEQEK